MKAFHTIKPKTSSNSTNTPKSLQGIWITILVTLSVIFIPLSQAIAAAVKWHPGHYYELVGQGSKSDSSYLNKVYSELQTHPTLRGVVIRYQWGELEKAKSDYNFTVVAKRLSEVAAKKKRLIVLIETKSTTPDTKQTLVPAYAKSAEYDGGIYQFKSGQGEGYGTKLWDPQIRDRMIALVQALGKRFNNEPYFEGIGFSESAMGRPIKPITSAQANSYYNNLLSINKALKTSFPNTLSFQFLNYPRDLLPTFINTFKQNGSALGNPDVFLEDPGLHFPGTKYAFPGVYTYYPKLSGKIPLVVQIEKANYLNTRHDNTGFKPSVNQLFNFARDELQVNYVFWTRTPNYYPKVLELLNFKAQKANPSGGLKSVCPSVYSSCVQ